MSSLRHRYFVECIKYQKILFSPLKKDGFLPENGSEVFVRNIPLEETEHDLLSFFEIAGDIFQFRLMMNENGKENRGFAYVTYVNSSYARKAVDTLNNLPYRGNYYLRIEHSLNNCRLFIGGIPTHKTKDQIWQELYKNGIKNIMDVIMYRSYTDRAENRGFVFVEFKTHEEAAYFRAKYGKVLRLWDNPVIVDWSVPIPQVDQSIMETVRIVYLRNLDVSETPEVFQTIILRFVEKEYLEKVFKFKNYAFVHLRTREIAENLLKLLKEYYKGTPVEVTWAKPPNKFTTQEYRQKKVCSLSIRTSPPKANYSTLPQLSPIKTQSSPYKSVNEECSEVALDDIGSNNSMEEYQFQTPPRIPFSRIINNCQTTLTYQGSIMSPTLSPLRENTPRMPLQGDLTSDQLVPTLSGNIIQWNERTFPASRLCFCSTPLNTPVGYISNPLSISLPASLEPLSNVEFLKRRSSLSSSLAYYRGSPLLRPSTPVNVPNLYLSSDPIQDYQQNMSEIYDGNTEILTNLGNHCPRPRVITDEDRKIIPRNLNVENVLDFIGDILD